MAFANLYKRLKTPEFVTNNGGWWAFTVFIGIPAALAIGGVVDPIFDYFLTLFSVDAAHHIVTHWAVKYSLFIVFFFIVPSSIYLLVIRLNPSLVESKAAAAYKAVTEEVSRIYAQLYDGESPRHNLGKLHLVFHVDSKYGLTCDCKVVLIAKDDLHFWKYAVGSEPEGAGHDFVADIGFNAKVAGRDCAYLPLNDTPHWKELAIAFLPYLKKGDRCEVEINWSWPGCMGLLRDKGAENYGWSCTGFDDSARGDLVMQYIFDKKLGDIQCSNVGINPPGAQLTRDPRPNEIIWTFKVPNAPLGKGTDYALSFKRG